MTGEKYELSYYEQYAAFLNRRFPFPFPDYVFEFKDTIDGELLQTAVEKALELHPTFNLTLRDREEGFYLEPVDTIPKVVEADWKDSITFGEDGLMWVVTYSGRRMVFTAFHLLCDGMGAMSFLRDVLKYYFCGNESFSQEEDKSMASTCENPYMTAVPKTAEHWQDIDYNDLSSLDFEQYKAMDAEPVLYRFDFAKDDIKAQARESGTSTSAVVAYYLAKAMAGTLGKDAGKLSIAVVADLRRCFDSRSDRNFTAESNLIYDIAREKEWSRIKVQQDLRNQLDEFLCISRQQARIAQEHQWQKDILAMTQEDQIAERNFLFQTFCTLRANICYSHLTRLGLPEEVEAQLEDFHVAGAKGFSPRICVFGSNLKDKVTITISQYLKNDCFVELLSKQLEADRLPFRKSVLDLHGNMSYKLEL